MTTKAFYDGIRPLFAGGMSQVQKDNVDLILSACMDNRLDRQRAASVLATAFWETGGLKQGDKWPEENLSYSAERMREVWPDRIPEGKAAMLARRPEALANYVYALRNGNGPERSGDGWRFRGRGPVQITGRANYRKLGDYLGIRLEDVPELACDKKIGVDILVAGMITGMFTGVSLDDVSEPGTTEAPVNFVNDRQVVNGRDRAKKIAQIADTFYSALVGVDLLARSRTVRAAKAQRRVSNVGVTATTGTAVVGGVTQVGAVLVDDPDSFIEIARKGITYASVLSWQTAGWIIAVGLTAALVYQRIQAGKIEKARREDNEMMGV